MIHIWCREDKDEEVLANAEAICRALISNVRGVQGRQDSKHLLSSLSLYLARIVRAQGRLDEARQLCEESISQSTASSNLFPEPLIVCIEQTVSGK